MPSFNGATTLTSWKTGSPARTGPAGRRFNGATTLTSWKTSPKVKSFADEMALQWGHDFDVVEDMRPSRSACPTPTCFNGATTLTSWKTPIPPKFVPSQSMLQWGHDFDVVEDLNVDVQLALPRNRFNGATTLTSWKTAGLVTPSLVTTYETFRERLSSRTGWRAVRNLVQ